MSIGLAIICIIIIYCIFFSIFFELSSESSDESEEFFRLLFSFFSLRESSYPFACFSSPKLTVTLPFEPLPTEHFPQTIKHIHTNAQMIKIAYHSRPVETPLIISLNISVIALYTVTLAPGSSFEHAAASLHLSIVQRTG